MAFLKESLFLVKNCQRFFLMLEIGKERLEHAHRNRLESEEGEDGLPRTILRLITIDFAKSSFFVKIYAWPSLEAVRGIHRKAGKFRCFLTFNYESVFVCH